MPPPGLNGGLSSSCAHQKTSAVFCATWVLMSTVLWTSAALTLTVGAVDVDGDAAVVKELADSDSVFLGSSSVHQTRGSADLRASRLMEEAEEVLADVQTPLLEEEAEDVSADLQTPLLEEEAEGVPADLQTPLLEEEAEDVPADLQTPRLLEEETQEGVDQEEGGIRIEFTASLPSDVATSLQQDAPFVFHTVLKNQGQCYDPPAASFTAPVSGVYTFLLRIKHLRHEDSRFGDVHVVKEHKVICSIVSDDSPQEEEQEEEKEKKKEEEVEEEKKKEEEEEEEDKEEEEEKKWVGSLLNTLGDSGKYWANSFSVIWDSPRAGNLRIASWEDWSNPPVAKWDSPPTLNGGNPTAKWDIRPTANRDSSPPSLPPSTADWLEGTCEGLTYLKQGDKVTLTRKGCHGDARFVTGTFSGYLLSPDY